MFSIVVGIVVEGGRFEHNYAYYNSGKPVHRLRHGFHQVQRRMSCWWIRGPWCIDRASGHHPNVLPSKILATIVAAGGRMVYTSNQSLYLQFLRNCISSLVEDILWRTNGTTINNQTVVRCPSDLTRFRWLSSRDESLSHRDDHER